ncbi:MAG TPA: polysaccharide deacetylase family protein, partial [Candidatus Nocardiopsis merdipullorum]|nr:polysaccharide deacetylase family protein [Candidatus Nocardiopsis merdipullorum]
MKKQSRPTMAPDHPVTTVIVALVILSGMFFLAVQSSGPVTSDRAQSAVEDTAPEETEPLPAEGEPDGQTVVPAEVVEGLEEVELTHESDLTTQVNYPRLPHAEPLSDFLDHTLTTEI